MEPNAAIFIYLYLNYNSLLISLLQKGVYDARHSLFVITTLFYSYTKSLIYPHNDPGDVPWASSLVLSERRRRSLQAETAHSGNNNSDFQSRVG
jgi:hypothetical protein